MKLNHDHVTFIRRRSVAWTVQMPSLVWSTEGSLQKKAGQEVHSLDATQLQHRQGSSSECISAKCKHVIPHKHPLPTSRHRCQQCSKRLTRLQQPFSIFSLIQPRILELGSSELSSEWSEKVLRAHQGHSGSIFQRGIKILI